MIITLEEDHPVELEMIEFKDEWALILKESFSRNVHFDPPTLFNGYKWRLTSLGYVGFIPLTKEVGLHLKPKVGLSNLFRMLDIAYKVPITIQEGFFQSESLKDFYEQLASYLAKRVLERGRKGYYRSYVAYEEELSYLRERVNLINMVRAPWRIPVECNYHEHTADIEDNQILSWTLETILRSGLLKDHTQSVIRKAYKEISSLVSSKPFYPFDCIHRIYNRLNDDYRPLHWLCRFFLEHTGPTHLIGERMMSPFLIDMSYLFEAFVAEWLKENLPQEWLLIPQFNVTISTEFGLQIKIDLVIKDKLHGNALCVLDTKYKKPNTPDIADINQIVTYAEMMDCKKGVLIYPSPTTSPIHLSVGGKQIKSMVFNLSENLDKAGKSFTEQLSYFL